MQLKDRRGDAVSEMETLNPCVMNRRNQARQMDGSQVASQPPLMHLASDPLTWNEKGGLLHISESQSALVGAYGVVVP